jgi:hypothetical protein
MSWSDHMAELDAAAFAHLSDDVAATWSREGLVLAVVPVMVDRAERPSFRNGLSLIDAFDVARVSVAALGALQPALVPAAGDVWTVSGRPLVAHGEAWRDEEIGGRDWLIPVHAAA